MAALSSIALGSLLFVQVGKSATAKAYNLTTLARFHSEAMALFYRAQGITDDKQTPQLETELNTWQGGVSEWLQAHLPIYAPMFLEAARKNTIFYRHTEGETVPGERVPYRANLIANHAQERAEMIGRIMRSVAGREPD